MLKKRWSTWIQGWDRKASCARRVWVAMSTEEDHGLQHEREGASEKQDPKRKFPPIHYCQMAPLTVSKGEYEHIISTVKRHQKSQKFLLFFFWTIYDTGFWQEVAITFFNPLKKASEIHGNLCWESKMRKNNIFSKRLQWKVWEIIYMKALSKLQMCVGAIYVL